MPLLSLMLDLGRLFSSWLAFHGRQASLGDEFNANLPIDRSQWLSTA